ncbi:MAG: metallophosphoesterase family protein [Chitinophaga sp.]|uniref:metallophosphoesterase family protein n=1 Tax=Chitinophaga sp. TaxID=1869181 RepID=UPI001B2E7E7C|nr:metallophosphoesterase [Chitinophaga sp.]MBO9732797.1 metallophosphoesterase family protein [Chitinophaga sp.]
MKNVIAYITDPHLDEAGLANFPVNVREDMKNMLQEVHAAGIKNVVIGGDIGDKASHTFTFDLLRQYAGSVKLTLGNHDKFKEVITYYNPLPSGREEMYYSEEHNGYKHIFLDSSAEEISAAQLEWFKQEMQTNKKVILFVHHPILGVNAEVDRAFPLKGRDDIAAVLQQHPNNVYIFCGHLHLDDEQTQGHIQQYVTPAVSVQFVKDAATLEMDHKFFGYRIIEINDDGIDTEVMLKQRS